MAITKTHQAARRRLKPEIHIPECTRSVILFGHADADGHLATEHSRDWLVRRGFSVTTVVSSATRNYRFWGNLSKFDLSNYDMIVTVDIAFRFRTPHDSLARLLDVTDNYTDKQFIVIDHHPLVKPEETRSNVQLIDVQDPYDCCLGEPNPELMQVSALCDGAPTAVQATPKLSKRALGVKRAAADTRGVAGSGLLKLIREYRWAFFEELAEEEREMHRNARGIRSRSSVDSPLLQYARQLFHS